METPSSTDPPTHAHQFWRWMGRTSSSDGWGAPVLAMAVPDPHPPVRWRSAASRSTCAMEAGRIGVARHTTPELDAVLVVDNDATPTGPRRPRSDPPSFLPCVHGTTTARGRPMCVVDQEVENRLALLVHITSLCFPLDTWRERRKMADEGMANCIDIILAIILPPLGVILKFACGVSFPSFVPVPC
ncbi:hypothetical protein VPH35_123309 [Triticum aestivum]